MRREYPLLNAGTLQNPTFVPAELCSIVTGQPVNLKLEAGETRDMLGLACLLPKVNAQSITQEGRALFKYDESSGKSLVSL